MDLKLEDLKKLIELQNKEMAKLEGSVAKFKEIIEAGNRRNAVLEKENHTYHERLRRLNGRLTIIMEGNLDLVKAHPDMWLHTNRWKKKRFVSESINSKVTNLDICHNCGCCSDSPLEVWPYYEYEGVKVYSEPPVFTVGEKCGHGDRPYEDWESALKRANIPDIFIAKIQSYFDENSSFYDDEQSDEDTE